MQNQYLIKIVVAPFAVLVLHIIATLAGWYELIWWLDKPLHFLGGIAVATSTYYLISYFQTNNQLQINWLPLKILAITAAVALCAVAWEFLEFYLDMKSVSMMQASVRDTMTDIVMGLLGGMITAIVITYINRSKQP